MEVGYIKPRKITEEMEESYLDYAMSVIVSRALPDVRDGLKPVHRRILYSMYELGLKPEAKYRKSAAVVGDVLGKYHPHGDMAVYDSLVRMAQDFSLRYPLINGQGNFGCFTKDTKVKLTNDKSLTFEELIKEAKKGKRNWTFSFNPESKEIEIAEIKNPRLTRKKEKIIEITLDNKEKIRCTLDHRFMLRDSSYKKAKDLRPGDSLMPLYTNLYQGRDSNLKGYKITYQPLKQIWNFTHHLADVPKIENALNYFGSFSEIVAKARKYNHRVVAVKILRKREDVYDLTIDPYHNFSLDAGIFVHNSMDGDSAAAQRYTECKLSHQAQEMLADIEKQTVSFLPNYDGTRKEPSVLPAKLPQLLINGTMGIAVGMATNIPPHNISEVIDGLIYLIDHPRATLDDLIQFIKGPDFPTGGAIYDIKEITQAYATGKGGIVCRAKADIEELKSGKFQIIISELTYQVNKAVLVEKIANLVKEKRIEGVKDIRDESDRNGVRVVIDLKSDAYPRKVLNRLFKLTDLQKTFHLNMVALTEGLQPKVLNLKSMLEFYLKHREEVVTKRTKFDLSRAEERAHILKGLKKALDNINQVIKTIKQSKNRDTAKTNLIKKFKFSDRQAEAILEMKLQTLAALERKKIEDELKEKMKLAKELETILKSRKKILEVIKKEFLQIKEKYGDERKTKIFKNPVGEFADEDLIPEEETVITVTKGGYIKRINPSTYRVQKRGGKGIIGMATRQEDVVEHLLTASTFDNLLFFTNQGRVFKTKTYEIPEASRTAKGQALVNFLQLGPEERITALVALNKDKKEGFLTMATKNGIIKKTKISQFEKVRRSGLVAIRLRKNDELEWVDLTSGQDEVILATKLGQAIRFKEGDVRPMGRPAGGVTGIRLKKGDRVIGMDIIMAEEKKSEAISILIVTENGYGKRTALKLYKIQKRGGSGIRTVKITSRTGPAVFLKKIGPIEEKEDLVIVSQRGQIIRISLDSIPKMGRSTQGVRIMRLAESDKIASATCV